MFMKFDMSIFRKSVKKTQVSLKYDKNNVYFTSRPMCTYGNISLNDSSKDRLCRQNLWRKSKHTFYVQ
jgi:hypothetical protein